MSKMLKVVGASWVQTKISSYILCFLGVLAILALFVGQMERIQEDGNYAATVYHSQKTGYRIEYWGQSNDLDDIPRGVARAHFRMDVETDGWSILEIETDESYPDNIQAYAAGIVEGALTWHLIHAHLENTIRRRCDHKPINKQCDRLQDTLDQSASTIKKYAADKDDPFWHHVFIYYTQIEGMFAGWKHGVERSMSEYETDISDLYWLNAQADVEELQHKMRISVQDPVISRLPGLASAFIRIANETADDGTVRQKMFVAQNAVGSYSSMTRILKRYKLNYHLTAAEDSPLAPGTSVEFSGYPGSLTSQDEFYLVQGKQHKLAITGTALRNYNDERWKDVDIMKKIPVGPRVTAANYLASNISSWTHILARNSSGTASKQWMVIDLSKLEHHNQAPSPSNNMALNSEPKTAKKDAVVETFFEGTNGDVKHTIVHRGKGSGDGVKDLVWLIEQVPGRTHSGDLSNEFLKQTYWATYGLPYFKDIAEATHTNKMEVEYGTMFSEKEAPRALIFKHGYKNATSLKSIIRLMRQYNMTAVRAAGYETEICRDDDDTCIYKEAGYWTVLGSRGDEVTKYKEPYGVIDTKVLCSTPGKPIEFIAISSPPYTEMKKNSTQFPLNKGTIAFDGYTDQFDDEPTIDGLEIRDIAKQQREEAEQEYYENLYRDVVKPFQWSDSDFKTDKPKNLPDKWDFGPYKSKWSW